MQTITSKSGVVAQRGTRADMTCAVAKIEAERLADGRV